MMKKHGLLMLLCCLAPILLLMVFGKSLGLNSWVIFLLCPLMHVVMMFFMKHDQGNNGGGCHSKSAEVNEK